MKLPDGTEIALPKKSQQLRDIIDKHEFKGEKLRDLSRKKLVKVLNLLLMYAPQIEGMAKYFENEWKKCKEEKKDEQLRKTEIITKSDL